MEIIEGSDLDKLYQRANELLRNAKAKNKDKKPEENTQKAFKKIENLEASFEEEKLKTEECLADVLQLLSHDTSTTRRQLATVLRQRARLIETEFETEQRIENIIGK